MRSSTPRTSATGAAIRVVQLPKGPSTAHRLDQTQEEYGATVSRAGRIAFVSTRDGTPELFVAEPSGALAGAVRHDSAGTAACRSARPRLGTGRRDARVRRDARGRNDRARPRRRHDADGPARLLDRCQPARHTDRGQHRDRPRVDRDRRDRCSTARPGQAARLACRPARHTAVPESRAAAAERARDRAHPRALALGFTSMVDNRGPGILWIHATRPTGSNIMDVRQMVQLASGSVRVDPMSGGLKYVDAPPHHHWHFLGFDHYELRSASDFKLSCATTRAASASPTTTARDRRPARAAAVPRQLRAVRSQGAARDEGSSVGYTDRYPAFFHGQQLDITKVPAGRYWLVHRANEDFHLRERSYGDDTASLLDPLTVARRRAQRDDAPHRACTSAASSGVLVLAPRRSGRARAGTRPG